MALPIVPTQLHIWVRLSKAWSWASTRGRSRMLGAGSAMPIVLSTLHMGLRLGRQGSRPSRV